MDAQALAERLALRSLFSANHVFNGHKERNYSCSVDMIEDAALPFAEAHVALIDACDFALSTLEALGNGKGDAANACRAALSKARATPDASSEKEGRS